ncbi:MAG: glutamate-1-semialdehyde 2 1-aminomutase [Candidatus Saganbacteria bacterium]|uniref:Glutamate-1-semialdehyde 2 1-aminomutase n=1 Tax=Candidatus Saganbacteria bacterium TaxID=2575572 RepID=A0A833L2I5_UNCSA|nr:MAG: glutamate-1-semialdehyde 2 1-aminomutase [Candidatus Saganbacteria bacterium]
MASSNEYLARSQESLASASTFNKVQLFGNGRTPFCLVRGDGAYTWDVDGNKYIDYIIGLGTMTLGHNHPVVNKAISEQLKKGISFSLPTPLEIQVAEMLIERIPSAEKVKFGKNGNDATSAAVRLARYYTGRDHILFCGYHGWQDWYVCQTSKNGGIPKCIGELSHRFVFNDINFLMKLLKDYKDNIACIILEPIPAKEWPRDNFLEKVREIATNNNVVLIFDEVVTGFRFHKGGAQALFNIVPDLSCFSKAIANGMPLSAIVGKAGIMSKFNDVYFSLTNAGETLSLAAAKAVLAFYDQADVPAQLARSGAKLREGIKSLIVKYNLSDRMEILGFDCRFGINFIDKNNLNYDPTDDLLYWIELVAAHGILSAGWHMISYAHTDRVIEETLMIYGTVLPKMRAKLEGRMEKKVG